MSAIGSTIYPKRRLFEQVVDVFQREGRVVPVFLDKHLSDNWADIDWIASAHGEIVVVSLGFDTYEKDPIGDLALTTAGYHEMGRRVAALGRSLVVLQEGGYHVGDLGRNAVAWLRGASGRPAAGA